MTLRNYTTKKLTTLIVSSLIMTVMSAQALTISPARAELTADPGETISDSFVLINEQNSDQTFYTSVENFDSQGESGTPNFTASKDGFPSWVKVEETVVVKKGEKIKVPYSITVPNDADAGGHFAAIFLSTVPPSTGDGQVSVGAKVGMLVLLKVTGNVEEKGGLLSFLLKEEKTFLTNLPLTFVYRFKNDGNDRVQPIGNIVVKNIFGVESAQLDANKASGNVLPGSVRRFEIRYGDDDAPDVSKPFFDHVKFQMNHFAFGVYFADINLTFGNSSKATSSLTYFVLPWQLMIVAGFILGFIIILFTLMLKHYNKWVIKQARSASKQ